jgi:hypothetical protein
VADGVDRIERRRQSRSMNADTPHGFVLCDLATMPTSVSGIAIWRSTGSDPLITARLGKARRPSAVCSAAIMLGF